MTPQEIKQNMTHGEWKGKDTTYTKEEPFVVTPEDGGTPWVACERTIFANDVKLGALYMHTVSSSTIYPTTVNEISADHAAITTAVNGTYGVGIDPSKVEEMYRVLSIIGSILDEGTDIADGSLIHGEITALLTAAKL